ncbi:tRNA (adenosine(37)-N6)-threonylcarbamoyltransferase complex ATPase subunit type 1 TsaE [Aerococcaceae bacterium DSM 111021]|nr:tRNA (adenosine(37)-N6)-threonylcarbamoyltransferase complex ATPase subunit type 1 TsaE [Aerococcaceae bacterium DSM 111021]
MSHYITQSAEETKKLAGDLAQIIELGKVISLKGNLGSGKTTFSQGFAKALGIKRAVKSPTYTIVKQYPLDEEGRFFNHIDAYRLEEGGADSIDLESFIDNDTITLIEWAEFVIDYMPDSYLEIELLSIEQEERKIQVRTVGNDEYYEQLMKEWTQNWKGL